MSFEDICKKDEFKLEILKSLERMGREAKRSGLEIIKNAYLTTVPFSAENNTMTPTQKIKRYQAGKLYENEIKMMYLRPPIDLKSIP